MDFTISEEQKMTADVLRQLLDDVCTPAQLRVQMDKDEAFDADRWTKLVELGLTGIMVAEEQGGLGLREADLVLLAEEAGRAALPEPLIELAGVVAPLLAGLSDQRAPDSRIGDLLGRVLAGEAVVAAGHRLNPFVANADMADALLLDWAGEVHLVERSDVKLVRQESIDPFRRLFAVEAKLTEATRLADAEQGQALWNAALERGALFAAAQCLGLAQRNVNIAVDYAGQRTQFGKLIGSYQAIKHHLATVQVKIEFARPVVQAAAAQFDPADLATRARVSHAKLAATAAADLAGQTAVQVHGAMGYSWEVDVHFFLKRAIALTGAWGDRSFHLARVADRLFDSDLPLGADRTFARESETHAA